MIKTMIIVANGFEEIEMITVLDLLRRADITVDLVSTTDSYTLIGAHNIKIQADKKLSEIEESDYLALILPGGLDNAQSLQKNIEVLSLVETFKQTNRLICAICAAPIVFAQAGVAQDKKITSYPGFEAEFIDSTYLEDPVVVDLPLITARGVGYSIDFALAIIGQLKGEKEVKDLSEKILYH